VDRTAKALPDDELLCRFLDRHDEAAFAELVAKHLPAVRAVCRSVLRDLNDVEDAAQATFLVLVRRAGSVRNQSALGAWLCRIAWRTAVRLRATNQKRAARQQHGIDPDTIPERATELQPGDTTQTVEEEIDRLPERYRQAVCTCYVAGLSTAAAADRLGLPKGTLLTRLAWARKRLRDRLTKRGVSLHGSLAAILAASCSGAADAVLASRIAIGALALLKGSPVVKVLISERVLTLMEGTVSAMFVTKVKLAVVGVFLLAALVGLGLGRSGVLLAEAGPAGKAASATSSPVPADNGLIAQKGTHPLAEGTPAKADGVHAGPGNELTVRQPNGTFSREVAPFGKAVVTFTENRLHVVATIRVEKLSLTFNIDADYSMNRESVVFGIITAVDMTGGDEEVVAEVAGILGLAHDIPFAFRIRVEDECIIVKDIKCGPIGTHVFTELLGKGAEADGELNLMLGAICGKYKADPNADRTLPPAPPRAKKK
jgi:RNA polymerase sigma factor (sigma-70 family)